MQVLNQFSLPILGLEIGQYEYSFELNGEFFKAFEKSPFQSGSLVSKLRLEKKHDHLILDFDIDGHLNLECNRCNDLIAFPVLTKFQVLIKYDLNEREEEEIVYINPESSEYNCSKIMYEAIILSLPLIRTCDEVKDKDCNSQVIKYLDSQPEENKSENALSNALKNLKLN